MNTLTVPQPARVIVLTTMSLLLGLLAANAKQPKQNESNEPNESVDVRYARAYVDLARLDLQRALEMNKEIPHVISATLVERLRQNVAIAEEQLKQMLKGQEANLHHVHLREAEAAVKIAEADADRVSVLHRKIPGDQSALDVRRSRAAAKVAALRLERARDPRNFASVIPHLQWQIENLREQVLHLELEVERLSSRF